MTYSEAALLWIRRILIILLAVAVIGMAFAAVIRARQAVNRTDAYIQYLDAKYGW